jgi:ABC-type lipoprotein release transport system permease subunit
MKLIFQLSLRNIIRYKRRNAMLLMAIAVAVACVAGMNTIIRGLQYDMMDAAVENLSGHYKVHAPGYLDDPSIEHSFRLPTGYVPDVPEESLMGWAPRVRVPGVIMSERETRGVQLVGINPGSEGISFITNVAIEGEALTGPDDQRMLLGKELAEQLETSVGRRIVIISQGADGKNRERGYRIAGLFDADGTALEKAYAFTGITVLQQLLGSETVTEVSVRLVDEPQASGLKETFTHYFADLRVFDWQELNPQAAAMFLFADGAIYIWFLLMMSALTFGLINTLIASVMERVRELGMLRALGMPKYNVVLQVVVESSIIMAIGVAIGLLLGYFMYLSIADGIDLSSYASSTDLMGISNVLMPRFLAGDFTEVAVMSLSLGVLASLYPAWRAVKIKPLDAIRN